MKTFGKSSEFLIDIVSKEQNSDYGCLSLVICEQIVLSSKEGNLSFLCVDLESFEIAKSIRFRNNYFWSISDEKIIQYWKAYYGSKSKNSKFDFGMSSDQFDELFFQSYIPFKSDFFDEFIFIGLEEFDIFHIKFWQKNDPDRIFNFSINDQSLFTVIKSATSFLREILS